MVCIVYSDTFPSQDKIGANSHGDFVTIFSVNCMALSVEPNR